MRKISRISLVLCLLVLVCTAGITLFMGVTVPAQNYDAKLVAADYMDRAMASIRDYRTEVGLVINPDDIHETGLIGQSYTLITTTLGAVEAKRTTANSDMAALVVELLDEAGIQPGDTVAAGFSGSFPAMNLAVLSACAAMDVEVRYIASAGASTFGANEPELTFPDMVYQLVEEGIFPSHAVAFSLGGASDCGLDMDPDLAQEILERLEARGIPVIYELDFQTNLSLREEFYGDVDCYIGVGGNITTSGTGENDLSWGVIEADTVTYLDETSGLMERYNAKGLPIIHLLNIKELVADYGLAYDPAELPRAGTSAIYYTTQYPILPPCIGLGLALAILWWGRWGRKKG